MAKTQKEPKKKTSKESAPKKSKPVEKTDLTKQLAEKLLIGLGVDAKLTLEDGDEGSLLVKIETTEPGVMIGFHGETLSSFQLILGMMVYRQTGEWTRILVNVNDYRERRQENLERIALAAAQNAKETGQPQALSPMNSAERRLVHLFLSEDSEVETESEGENWQRHVVIKPVEADKRG